MSPVFKKKSDGHCIVNDDKIYAIGGFDGTSCHSTVEEYDAGCDKWITLKQNMRSR
ncbi:unnamed protein product, partial [Anisakis simplex]|uniref:Kelch-like protein 10 n=1 Tax=Anisakis simplex TaxID=6269 RepID=A0A0M3JQQ0_ANISI